MVHVLRRAERIPDLYGLLGPTDLGLCFPVLVTSLDKVTVFMNARVCCLFSCVSHLHLHSEKKGCQYLLLCLCFTSVVYMILLELHMRPPFHWTAQMTFPPCLQVQIQGYILSTMGLCFLLSVYRPRKPVLLVPLLDQWQTKIVHISNF